MKVTQELTKLYYTIGEVAELFDVSPSLLRHWESTFDELHSKRSRKGDRRYTTKDIQLIEQVYTLVKERGFTLEGAKRELKQVKKRDYLKSKLERLKSDLVKLRNSL